MPGRAATATYDTSAIHDNSQQTIVGQANLNVPAPPPPVTLVGSP